MLSLAEGGVRAPRTKGPRTHMDTKWFLSSSTVLGGLSLAAMVIGPLFGLSEIQVDSLTGALVTLIVVAGRDNARTRLTLTPEALRRAVEGLISGLAALRKKETA